MKKQQGMTLIGMLLTMAVVALSAIVVLRIVPVYIQYYSIVQSIKSLNSTPLSNMTGDTEANVAILRASLTKRLDMNGIEDLKPKELSIISEGDNIYDVKLNYQVIRPLISNISLFFDFQRTDKVKAGSEN